LQSFLLLPLLLPPLLFLLLPLLLPPSLLLHTHRSPTMVCLVTG
jgi:hypothetical protein